MLGQVVINDRFLVTIGAYAMLAGDNLEEVMQWLQTHHDATHGDIAIWEKRRHAGGGAVRLIKVRYRGGWQDVAQPDDK